MQFNASGHNRKKAAALPGPEHTADPVPETQTRPL